uniref:Uncharacterized protein n=1 Tax=Strombidium inclinatum TaxID=197538 RepID=A0A7S3N1R3_9SPIT|mmetsp:Transcript_39656/g.60738  ORF Transcript_39656/g.60738 Transcript_39656/m.60738 type:complete len:111 (+) Transcript_39656:75-407(+)|eukprot:CAMPEP_0170487208 /NCGR_PEP_ID=MMETSP0208-20121228/6069_1 /TAXON_ID=197538 /ORGANISM="Strombidium inclinatum, Strain S3" /LENGTH=110 /DNA_ID=CAMNT_0010761425 /DNA_START=32 /DNA_END=364 /DNA_ORIENTATION=-
MKIFLLLVALLSVVFAKDVDNYTCGKNAKSDATKCTGKTSCGVYSRPVGDDTYNYSNCVLNDWCGKPYPSLPDSTEVKCESSGHTLLWIIIVAVVVVLIVGFVIYKKKQG